MRQSEVVVVELPAPYPSPDYGAAKTRPSRFMFTLTESRHGGRA
jgi:hypothetical protein